MKLDPRTRPLLVYNTGRTIADTQALVTARQLPVPEFIIGSVGTELHDTVNQWGAEFRAQFGENWNVSRVDEIVSRVPGIKRQPAGCHNELKSSWFWIRARREELEDLEHSLSATSIAARVIYSCRYFLDVVPHRAGKGEALAWLCLRLGIPFSQVVVAGDTANDTAMFLLPEINGIVVENALPELLAATINERTFVAQQPMADGVIAGLVHFGIFSTDPVAV
jgi:sucrose-6F-phosphate phosphohydrolase